MKYRNILKYTIGLPILLFATIVILFVIFLSGIALIFSQSIAYILGENLNDYLYTDTVGELVLIIQYIWQPIRR